MGALTNKHTHKCIPTLRFSEFKGNNEWSYVHGNELFVPIINKNHHSDLPVLAITQDQGAVPREMIDYNVIVSEKSIAGYKVVEIGDFIISLRSFQGGIEYSNYNGLCSPAYIILRKKDETICNDFYRHYFKSYQFIQDLNRNLEGIRDGKMISYQQFSEILIPYPPLAEQQRIANCLSSIDSYISSINEKIEQLKAHKKSFMQKLFPRNGQTVPEYRFPEFEKDGAWEEKRLGDFLKVRSGYAFKSNTYITFGKYKIVTIRNVKNGRLEMEEYNTINNLPTDIQPHQILRRGDVLVSMTGNVGRVCKVDCDNCLLNQRVGLLERYTNNIDEDFVLTIITNICFEQTMIESGQGAAQANISNKDIEDYCFLCPQNLNEQHQIAMCLSPIDSLTKYYLDKVAFLKQSKNGLTQQLFPKQKAL